MTSMIRYLLDTNIVSELSRPRPNPVLSQWIALANEHAVSTVTLEEIGFGLAWHPNARIERFMNTYFNTASLLNITPEIAKRCGSLRGEFRRKGISRHQSDMLIAATAQAHNLTLVTRNIRDFDGCGIALLDPCTA